MVATILKKVTNQGIEVASKTSSSAGNNSGHANNATVTPPAKSAFFTESNNTAIEPSIQGNRVENGYFDVFSKYASDVFTSTKETIYNASDEASKQMYNLASSFQIPLSKENEMSKEHEDKKNVSNTQAYESSSTPLKWYMRNDPYNLVTGRNQFAPTHHRKSVMAVRNLLELVDIDEGDGEKERHGSLLQERKSMRLMDEGSDSFGSDSSLNALDEDSHPGSFTDLAATTSNPGDEYSSSGRPIRKISKAETASRLSEGTVRAMRDMALNEALELHHALRYWTKRLENPLLFHMEFGPRWFSKEIHSHAEVGQKVSQLQAVLARRCSSIGQLQQHLWRAGWSSGVERWGILGQGEWAAVVGGHGLIDENQQGIFPGFETQRSPKGKRKRNKKDYYAESHLFVKNVRGGRIVRNDPALAAWSIDAIRVVRDQLYSAGSGRNPLPKFENWPREYLHFAEDKEKEYRRKSSMQKMKGGLWDSMVSIDGRSVFGDVNELEIPIWATYDVGQKNFVQRDRFLTGDSLEKADSQQMETELEDFFPPDVGSKAKDADFGHPIVTLSQGDFAIGDLSLMAAEVNEILNCMETYMQQQRKRRLDKLKPPSRIRRNWYILAFGVPIAGYMAYNLTKENRGLKLAKEIYQQTISFCAEHISEPLQSM